MRDRRPRSPRGKARRRRHSGPMSRRRNAVHASERPASVHANLCNEVLGGSNGAPPSRRPRLSGVSRAVTAIDRKAPVLVTGASGYIAGWIIKYLLEEGRTVHATVRDPSKKA